jgi:hypothetical protein
VKNFLYFRVFNFLSPSKENVNTILFWAWRILNKIIFPWTAGADNSRKGVGLNRDMYDIFITLSWLLVASFFALTLHMYYVFLFYLINLKFQVAKSELNPFDKIKGKLLVYIYYVATKIMNNKTMSSALFTMDQYIYELIGIITR